MLMTLLLFLGTLLVTMLIGVPIAYSLMITGLVLMLHLDMFDSQVMAQNIISGADSFPLMAIPFFMLAGELMNAGGISRRIVSFALTLVGSFKGGLGYVAILGSVLFAGLSGSAVADTAALGAILIPMMVKAGYDRDKASGLIASGGIIAPIIPPSIPMILFGVTANVSITKLFMGGIVPGIIMAIGIAVMWFFISRKDTFEVQPRSSVKEVFSEMLNAFWALLLPIFIIVGLRGGMFTPTEAGVIAVFYALFVGIFIYRELKLKDLMKVLIEASISTSVVMFLAAAAMVSAWLITIANIPRDIISFLNPFMDNSFILLLVLFVIILLVGMVMDITPVILILVPVLMPVVKNAGIDPVYFGIVFILANCIGLLTPPVGSVLNVAASVGKTSILGVSKGALPYIGVYICVVILLILFPQIVTYPIEFLTD
jgi:TRAP-type transport system large permease protein